MSRLITLFAGVGEGALAGWTVPKIEIPFDRIRATLAGPQGERLVLELRYPQGRSDAAGRTASFEVFLVYQEGLSETSAAKFLDRFITSLNDRDGGKFWEQAGGQSSSSVANISFSVAYIVGWQVAFLVLTMLCVVLLLQLKPWRDGGAPACLAIAGACLAAFILRRWVIVPGPAQLVARLPDSTSIPPQYPDFGCGYFAWILGWYWMLGTSDQTIFLAGAVIGSLGVVAAGSLAWAGGGGKVAGAAACLLALWPIHARLSPTDDPAGLIATLIGTALALMAVASRSGSRLALVGGWLAGFLAALTRPRASADFSSRGQSNIGGV